MIKEAQGCNLSDGAHQRVFIEKVAGLGHQFASHHLLVQAVVAIDVHMTEVCLRSFGHSHLQVDGVAHHIHLHGVDVREHVAVVPVVVAHGILVALQSFLYQGLVIHVALFHLQRAVQEVGVHHSVSCPAYVSHVVALSLFHLDIQVHVLLVVVPHTVCQYLHVAEAQFVVFVDKVLSGSLVAFGSKLLGLHKRAYLSCLVHLGEHSFSEQSSLYLAGFQKLVAFDDDVPYLHLSLLIYIYIQNHLVGSCHIIALCDGDFGVFVAFFLKVAFGKDFGAVNHVGGYLAALHNAQFGLHVFTFRFLQSAVVDGAYTWSLCKMDAEIHLGSHDRVGCNSHVREEAVLPVAANGFRYFCSGHRDALSHLQSGEAHQHKVVVALDALYVDAANLALAWCAHIRYFWVHHLFLCSGGYGKER